MNDSDCSPPLPPRWFQNPVGPHSACDLPAPRFTPHARQVINPDMGNKRDLSCVLLCLPALLLLAALRASADDQSAAKSTPAKPNFVLILVDDMGYGDVEPFNPQCP